MQVEQPTALQLEKTFACLRNRALQTCRNQPVIRYLRLGNAVVRLVICHPDFLFHVEAQFAYILRESESSYDVTLFVWKEGAFKDLAKFALTCDRTAPCYLQARIQKIRWNSTEDFDNAVMMDERVHHRQPVVEIYDANKYLLARDCREKTLYYAVDNLEPEEFIKRGHLFVHALARIIKSPTANLAHGAVVGLDGHGVLVCGMGYRGKSTLSVNALLHGFEYVSDDYLLLDKQDGRLRAWPIYSVITLSPAMYAKMGKRFTGRFVSNNGRKDKYVFAIESYHQQFREGYPVELCLFPRFTQQKQPTIVPGDKGMAMDEFVYSSVMQTSETQDMQLIAKLCDYIRDLPFYRFNLTRDIDANTEILKEFLRQRTV